VTLKTKSIILLAAMIAILFIMAAFSRDSAKITDAADAAKFLNSLGWQVPEQPSDVKEVLIPPEFDAAYERYNDLQKKQGRDLSEYRAKTVTRYTFCVTNHPSGEETFANLLVYNGKIIGGDICSYSVNGFMEQLTVDN